MGILSPGTWVAVHAIDVVIRSAPRYPSAVGKSVDVHGTLEIDGDGRVSPQSLTEHGSQVGQTPHFLVGALLALADVDHLLPGPCFHVGVFCICRTESMCRGVPSCDQEVQNQIAEVIFAQVLPPAARILKEQTHKAFPRLDVVPSSIDLRSVLSLGNVGAEFAHHVPVVVVKATEVLGRVSLGATTQESPNPPRWQVESGYSVDKLEYCSYLAEDWHSMTSSSVLPPREFKWSSAVTVIVGVGSGTRVVGDKRGLRSG